LLLGLQEGNTSWIEARGEANCSCTGQDIKGKEEQAAEVPTTLLKGMFPMTSRPLTTPPLKVLLPPNSTILETKHVIHRT
jgi:hypothetical protein